MFIPTSNLHPVDMATYLLRKTTSGNLQGRMTHQTKNRSACGLRIWPQNAVSKSCRVCHRLVKREYSVGIRFPNILLVQGVELEDG